MACSRRVAPPTTRRWSAAMSGARAAREKCDCSSALTLVCGSVKRGLSTPSGACASSFCAQGGRGGRGGVCVCARVQQQWPATGDSSDQGHAAAPPHRLTCTARSSPGRTGTSPNSVALDRISSRPYSAAGGGGGQGGEAMCEERAIAAGMFCRQRAALTPLCRTAQRSAHLELGLGSEAAGKELDRGISDVVVRCTERGRGGGAPNSAMRTRLS